MAECGFAVIEVRCWTYEGTRKNVSTFGFREVGKRTTAGGFHRQLGKVFPELQPLGKRMLVTGDSARAGTAQLKRDEVILDAMRRLSDRERFAEVRLKFVIEMNS